jgi:hypothetical protein
MKGPEILHSHHTTPARQDRRHPRQVWALVLWVVAILVCAYRLYLRWHPAYVGPFGPDYHWFFLAAQQVAAGHSPYEVRPYVYPPVIAFALAPFAHHPIGAVWKGWITVVFLFPLIGIGAFLTLIRGPRAWWLRPVMLAVCVVTMFYRKYYPMTRELEMGQLDNFVFSSVAIAAVAAGRASRRVRGGFIGLAGMVKVWPWGVALSFFNVRSADRRRELVACVLVALLAPALALTFGWSGLRAFIRNAFDAKSQNLVSDSVWIVPKLLFSRTDLARYVVVSRPLQVVVTLVLAAIVVSLLTVALRSNGHGAIQTWNVLFCVILLLPVSHRQYSLGVLPILWWWIVVALTDNERDHRIRALWVTFVLALWWLNQTVQWPYNGNADTISAVRYSAPFLGDMIACAVSVLAARRHCQQHQVQSDQPRPVLV